jgi:hypothetical protein
MNRHRRRALLALTGIIALGMALVAQPTEYREHASGLSTADRAHWVPGTAIPMSGFEGNVSRAPMPH